MEPLTCSNKEILFPKHLCTQQMTWKVAGLLAESLLVKKRNQTIILGSSLALIHPAVFALSSTKNLRRSSM